VIDLGLPEQIVREDDDGGVHGGLLGGQLEPVISERDAMERAGTV
jgi:hypothetical protein